MSFRHHEIATAGETRQTDVILDPTHIFHGRRTIVLFGGENACDATQPDRQACATLPIDKVARFCQKRLYGEEGGALQPPPFFNQLIYGVSDDDGD